MGLSGTAGGMAAELRRRGSDLGSGFGVKTPPKRPVKPAFFLELELERLRGARDGVASAMLTMTTSSSREYCCRRRLWLASCLAHWTPFPDVA